MEKMIRMMKMRGEKRGEEEEKRRSGWNGEDEAKVGEEQQRVWGRNVWR